ncbi:FKBP-type peptidyl-prolyl cis-trans isomerase [Ferrimonas senticii]|uniref:FKBP-type peptidyl-prolyl cis-trans isomerase n=1 Tax=Ferrimonas senticii TaxID=394566 RepID=UPI000417195D|nr:FKBP-type peptidyl-prolyl cis-trans isomerase [Ferrimonas senticii]
MKYSLTRTLISATVALAMTAPAAFAQTTFADDAAKESYAVGASMGSYMLGQLLTQQELGVAYDKEMVLKGISDAISQDVSLDQDTVLTLINARAEMLNEKVALKKAALAKENLEKGRAYLAQNAKKEGVFVTESGLQYEILEAGEEGAAKPKPEEVVTVHYIGKDITGEAFEDTYQSNVPAQIALINVIDGWNEGLQLMPVGAKYRFTIPSELAYGEAGMNLITPNSTLVFDIELIKTDRPGMGGHGGMGGMGGMSMNMGMNAH